MSGSYEYIEEHPLLYENLSDEDQRTKYTVRSRTRNKIKGAARAMSFWPEYWCSSFKIWWLWAGIFAVIVFVIYNCIAFVMLPPVYSTTMNYKFMDIREKHTNSGKRTSPIFPEVFMHVFVQKNEEVDLNLYVPSIKTLSNLYRNLTYNLIVVLNDTSIEYLSDEENNEIAMKTIMPKLPMLPKHISVIRDINILQVTLSSYMTNSPLKTHWKRLPYRFTEFLVRIISIWDKGGIAFNPAILSNSSNPIYLRKLKHVLKTFSNKFNTPETIDVKKSYFVYNGNNHKKNSTGLVNNIRDIINIMENENNFKNPEDNMLEAETRPEAAILNERKLFNAKLKSSEIGKNDSEINKNTVSQNEAPNINDNLLKNGTSNDKNINMLPLFLDFLFHNKTYTQNVSKPVETLSDRTSRRRKSILRTDVTSKYNSIDNNNDEKYQPIIILAKGVSHNGSDKYNLIESEEEECNTQLTIDLKGNIIATETACHAFIGDIFNRAKHCKDDETLTDFIISELSTFCKGVLSSCKGIDVILI